MLPQVTAAISFPEVLDISPYLEAPTPGGDYQYKLTAVLMHQGPSANSGHYTARILDQSTFGGGSGGGGGGGGDRGEGGECWWTFNDESVVLEEWQLTSKKEKADASMGVQLRPVEPGQPRVFQSKSAYMLNYTRISDLEARRCPFTLDTRDGRSGASHAMPLSKSCAWLSMCNPAAQKAPKLHGVEAPAALKDAVDAGSTALEADASEYARAKDGFDAWQKKQQARRNEARHTHAAI